LYILTSGRMVRKCHVGHGWVGACSDKSDFQIPHRPSNRVLAYAHGDRQMMHPSSHETFYSDRQKDRRQRPFNSFQGSFYLILFILFYVFLSTSALLLARTLGTVDKTRYRACTKYVVISSFIIQTKQKISITSRPTLQTCNLQIY